MAGLSIEDLTRAVLSYASGDVRPEAAVMIKGPWGCGKTYFWKTEIEPALRKLGRVPLYISLYGLESTADLNARILMARVPSLENANLQLLGALGAGALKKFTGIEAQKLREAHLPLNNHVLCFDDLERISPGVEYSDVLGSLNRFVEHEGRHVIFLAAEGEILKDERRGPGYSKAAEKLIWRSWRIEPQIEDVVQSCISECIGAYREFLIAHSDAVVEIACASGVTNLRTIKNAMRLFDCIFLCVKNNGRIPAVKLEELLKVLLRGFLGLYVEYSKERKVFAKLEALFGMDAAALSIYGIQAERGKTSPEEDEKYKDIKRFADDYLGDDVDAFSRCAALWAYVDKGVLNESVLTDELDQLAELMRESEASSETQLLSNFRVMEDDAFLSALEQVNNKIRLGQYASLGMWKKVAYYLMYLAEQGVVQDSKEAIANRVKGGVQIAMASNGLTAIDEDYSPYTDLGDEWTDLVAWLRTKEEDIEKRLHRDRAQRWYRELETDFTASLRESLPSVGSDGDVALLVDLDPRAVAGLLMARSNADLRDFCRWIMARYRPGTEPLLFDDGAALGSIAERLTEAIHSESVGPLRKLLVGEIVESAEDAARRLRDESERRTQAGD